jgi:cytochrome c-type biogenesis protein CcmH
LAEHLQENPENLEGWALLTRAYRNLGEWNFAVESWRRVLLLKGETASAQDWAQMAALLVQNAEGQVTPRAEEVARRALRIDPDEPEARHLLALAKAQNGDLAGAVEAWEEILEKAPPGAEWRPAIAQYLATARARMAAPQTGPSSEEVAAAAAMNPDERAAMIEGMVEGLAARLEDQPDDPQGWLRLARAYGVLGRKDDARSALNQAEERAEARLETGAAEPAPMRAVLAAVAAMRQEFGL